MTKIKWDKRYSETDDSDNRGRWARIVYAGNFEKGWNSKKERLIWEIAWIKKSDQPHPHGNFVVYPNFPCVTKNIFQTELEAKKFVEKEFRKFIKNCK